MRKGAFRLVPWVVALGGLSLVQQWATGRRPLPPELRAASEIVVTSLADAGAGTLRDALFRVAGTAARTRIRLPAGRILIETPLPPLAAAAGVIVDGVPGASVIDASALAGGPVLDIDVPGGMVRGVTILHAPEQAIFLRRHDLTVSDVALVGCAQGILADEKVERLLVERSSLTENGIGIRLVGDRSVVLIRASRFARHTDTAIWSVHRALEAAPRPEQLLVLDNSFDQDRIAVVIANTVARVESSRFTGARDAALVLIGEGVVVRGNRISGGQGVGIVAESTRGVVLEANEIDHNRAVGVMVRSSADTLVRNNRLYSNGYGLAFVFGHLSTPNTGSENTVLGQQQDGVIVIGGSPVLRNNRVVSSQLAGLRVLDFYSSTGERTAAEPLLQTNLVTGNAIDTILRGDYRMPRERKHE